MELFHKDFSSLIRTKFNTGGLLLLNSPVLVSLGFSLHVCIFNDQLMIKDKAQPNSIVVKVRQAPVFTGMCHVLYRSAMDSPNYTKNICRMNFLCKYFLCLKGYKFEIYPLFLLS